MLDTYDLKRIAEALDKLNDLLWISLRDERDIKIKFDQESEQYEAIV